MIVLRILYILNANPIGEFAQELVYLRIRELRTAGYAVLVVLLIETAQLLIPFLTRQGILHEAPDLVPILNTAEGVLILVAAGLVLLVVRRYTHRALDRRIRESMETLAYLEGQRRRRRSLERGEVQPVEEED
ncbi:MAG: hypothetical protein QOE90_3675 [Thermoplasmata archaeon]|jgi:hypothetical protein|nr:hypothetical protein [Thermoplasmata archaeon]